MSDTLLTLMHLVMLITCSTHKKSKTCVPIEMLVIAVLLVHVKDHHLPMPSHVNAKSSLLLFSRKRRIVELIRFIDKLFFILFYFASIEERFIHS